MVFGDLNDDAGLTVLNEFLHDKSYIDGYVPSQADVAVFELMSAAPGGKYCHALRWFNHVKSYTSQFEILPGIKKKGQDYGPAKKYCFTGAADDDADDDDMFGFAPPSVQTIPEMILMMMTFSVMIVGKMRKPKESNKNA